MAIKEWTIQQALYHSKRTVLLAIIITMIIGSGVRFILLDDNVMNMLPKDIDSRRVWDEIVDEFQYSDFLFVAFGRDGEIVLTKENLALVWDLTEAFEMVPQVDQVLSLSTMNRMESDEGFLEVNDLMPNRELSVLEIESIAEYLQDNSNLSARFLGKNGDYINIIIRPKMESDFPEASTPRPLRSLPNPGFYARQMVPKLPRPPHVQRPPTRAPVLPHVHKPNQ